MQFRIVSGIASFAVLMAASSAAQAGTFKNITVDGDFSDWAGVPVLTADAAGDGNIIDIANIQIANDATNLYIRFTYHTAVNPNVGPSLFLAFDTDNNTATGFNVYGLGTVGSEAGFQNDFPFDQRFSFNSGALTEAATIAPVDFSGATLFTSQEYSIPRSIRYVRVPQTDVFGNSFTLMAWTDANASPDTTAGTPYAFAVAPEPASLALVGAALGSLIRRKR